MSKYIQLAKKIKIHPLFWVVAGMAIITGYFWELLALFIIVIIHELGHAAAAQYFNWKIKRIIILPFGGMCEVDEHGNRPIKEELAIIAAGPIQHIFIAACLFILGMTSFVSSDYLHLLNRFNLMVLIFNLLPIWPLDGGKFVQLYFALRKPFLEACRLSMITSGIILAALHICILFYAPLNLNTWVVFSYLYMCLWMEWKQRRYVFMKFLLERYYGKQQEFLHLQPIDAKGDDYLHDAMEKFKRDCKHLIHIGGQHSMIGKLDENELLYAYFTEKRVSARLKDIVYND
ncbi:M50 family metallopeptidase [Lederbergia citrea]|uniref:M50 family metallopeptidase n=1 Tax=Lederbergia citrea TaxID=2833581 RepID=A0A942Z566_9BACI|nr:M50 family metallopeptidase [Lederbergia citrea]MBS4222571.1 M50 family metallopeptidase [Lederbergia citrea]